jgi:tetratricopeptide (TPR) repeat protein
MSVTELKEDGNAKFKAGNYEEALSVYTDALHLGDIKDTDKAVIYKNRSMCNLKLEKYKEAIDDASECKLLDMFVIHLYSKQLGPCMCYHGYSISQGTHV